jgi:DNA-binding transcriptional LysR family regulator
MARMKLERVVLPLELDEATALRGDLDVALGVFHDLAAELRTQTLFDDGYVCVAREGHARIHGAISLEQYVAARHVVVREAQARPPRGAPGAVLHERAGAPRSATAT